ncbi:MAG: PAS domain S-box protein, partial [Alphaproteobacteria bacterium]
QLIGHRDVNGKPVREALPEVAGQGFFELLDEVFLTGKPFIGRAMPVNLQRTPTSTVEQRFLDLVYQPIFNSAQSVTGIFVEGSDVTERVFAEADLRESEERSRRIVEGVRDHAVFTTDLSGLIVDWTPGAEAVFGWAKDEVVGQNSALLFTPEDRERNVPALELAEAREKGCANDERWHIRRDLTRFFANGSVRPLHNAGGGVAGFIKIARDETSRRATEAALHESEERYRTLFEAIDVGFCIVELKFDGDGQPVDYRLAEMNPAFENQTGLYGAAGKWVSEVAPGLERHWFEIYGRVALTGQPIRFENFAEAFGRWYDVHALRIGDPAAHRVAILFNNITERKHAEEALRELNATLETRVTERTADRDRMWRLSTDVMLVAHFDGVITSVNPAWTSLLGWSEAELVGSNFIDLVHFDDQPSTLAEMGKLGEGVTTFRFENRYQAKDGSYLWLSWTAVPAANLIHAVGRDITSDKQRADQLELAQEALRQSQKMEAMGQLTGGVAHDFNNLLTPIVGGLDMLQRKAVGGEREQRLIAGALQSADRAKTLVQRLLAFARRQPLQSTAVDIAALVSGMGDLVASTTGPQIRVVVDAADDLPAAMADPNQLEMALLNLSVNARDAMPNGGTLRITARLEMVSQGHQTQLKPGPYVCLSVADTGEGMDSSTLAKAVEPFFSTKGVGKGTGLGLSMVHGLASQLNGALAIESHVGIGTNIKLWLPVSASPPLDNSESQKQISLTVTRGMALLVDDEELARLSTADMLSDLGYEVVEASSAEEALRIIRDGARPDLLITDHLMPGMNGTELARLVQSAQSWVQVLIISGYAEVIGVDPDLARLTKPFRIADLVESLERLTTNSRAH